MNYISCLGILWQLRGVGPHPHLLTDCHKAKPELGAGTVQSGGRWIRQWHHLAIIKITLLNDKQNSTEGMLKLEELLTSLGTVFSFDFFRPEPLFSNYIKMELRKRLCAKTHWMRWGWGFGSLACAEETQQLTFPTEKSSFQCKAKREEFQNKSDFLLKLLIWNHFHWYLPVT